MATLDSDPDHFSDEQLAGWNISRDGLRAWRRYSLELDAGAPRVGEIAPPFALARVNPDGSTSRECVALDSLRGAPVALLFGSITCPVYRGQIPRYNAIHDELAARVQFLGIYVREAHPVDGWHLTVNDTPETRIAQPRTFEARARVAATAMNSACIRYPLLIDNLDDAVMTRYAGMPERLYALDADGVVRHRSEPGPFDDEDVQQWHAALRALPPR